MPALAADSRPRRYGNNIVPPPPKAAGTYRRTLISYNIQNKTTGTNTNPTIRLPPTTEKRPRPGPTGRNGVAFNDG
ncbi:hypothetical protein DOE63_32610 (plasmid) [Salmonella enterica subsp. diarizonae serovar 59:z10:-]|nr:hypothetical protein DOE63_32610 [Salmonella enterica subsp. diarizonae serovar 59:z10:-]